MYFARNGQRYRSLGCQPITKSVASNAASIEDAAVLVIAANEGVREQSRRHAYLLSLLGIRQIVVVVNKMDLAEYSENRFNEIEREYREFLSGLGLSARLFIPASAKQGANEPMQQWTGIKGEQSWSLSTSCQPSRHR